jgi:hypothetical protein
MFHDLNVPWQKDGVELQRTVAFLEECKRRLPLLPSTNPKELFETDRVPQ